MIRLYTISVRQESGTFSAELFLSSRVVNGALETDTLFKKSMRVTRKLLRKGRPLYREPHTVKQYVVNQFNSAYMDSAEYRKFVDELTDYKLRAFQSKRNLGPKPTGFKKLEVRQFRELAIKKGRLATPRECVQYFVIGLANVETALTPKANWPTVEKAESTGELATAA